MDQNLSNLILNCTDCELSKNMICGPLLGEGRKKVFFISWQPNEDEALINQQFTGRCGKLFDKICDNHSIKRRDIYLTFMTKCIGKSKHKCQWIFQEINDYKPELIITLGLPVLKSFVKVKTGTKIDDLLDMKFSYNTTPLFFLPSINSIFTNNKYNKNVTQIFNKIKDIVG